MAAGRGESAAGFAPRWRARDRVTGLPNTQAEQRAAIIRWPTGLAVLARKARFALPADLQVAGRGEIAPSPQGGS
jgi:hypothetical protein